MLEENMNEKQMITRKELHQLKSDFSNLKNSTPNPDWNRAYEQIIGGLDYLDACLARSTESNSERFEMDLSDEIYEKMKTSPIKERGKRRVTFGVNIYDKSGDIVEEGIYLFFDDVATVRFEDYDEFEFFIKTFSSKRTLDEIKENWDNE